jgi:hypothetical protein
MIKMMRRLALLLTVCCGSVAQADDRITLDEQHPRSHRHAVLEADEHCAWLYLSVAGDCRPEQDAFAYTPGPLVTTAEAMAEAKKGNSPPLSSEYASAQAVIRDAKAGELTFQWSADGQSLALLRNGNPLAMILAEAKRGFSKALSKSGFYGEPWDQRRYERIFGKK